MGVFLIIADYDTAWTTKKSVINAMTFIVPPHWEQVTGMAPACDLLHQGLRDELFPNEQGEDFALEELGHQAVLELSDMMKRPLKFLASLGNQTVEVRVKTDLSRLEFGEKL